MNSQKLLNINSLTKYLLIICVKSFLMKRITVLKTSFKMLFNSETLSFNSLWIVCLICFTITIEKMLNIKSVDNLLLMSLRSTYFFFKKNFSVRIYVLIKLLLLILFWSDLYKNKM